MRETVLLTIKNVHKEYRTGSLVQKALDGVSISFREREFVSILGPSGSGKTTLLNVIGGLDRYDSGEMYIGGVPTGSYKSRDWDTYRNHTIGFIFQSYNLIPHQTILSNVELAMTLSGIGKKERRKRAEEALDRVGLLDQAQKKPMQLSGGQMQRVAIARALVNRPSVLLADEPTGALDSDTGEQVMQLLKEVSKDHLVIMVTHNPDLADRYSTRIVRLRDGQITDDTMPLMPDGKITDDTMPLMPDGQITDDTMPLMPDGQITDDTMPLMPDGKITDHAMPLMPDGKTWNVPEREARTETGSGRTKENSDSPRPRSAADSGGDLQLQKEKYGAEPGGNEAAPERRLRKPSMSFRTALSLSVSNLYSKKTRTILVSFAASIGIIGIALILSLSTGANAYIERLEQDSLSQYPLQITSSAFSMEETMLAYAQMRQNTEEVSGNQVTEQQMMGGMLASASINDLASLKRWLDSGYSGIEEYTRGIDYGYGISPQIYRMQEDGYRQVNPDQTMAAMGLSMDDSLTGAMSSYSLNEVFLPLPENEELYREDYSLLAGSWPQKDTDCVLVLTGSGSVPDFLLYTMGLKDSDSLNEQLASVIAGKGIGTSAKLEADQVYDPEEFLGISFRLLPAYARYVYDEKLGLWLDQAGDEDRMLELLEDAEEMRIVGVVKPNTDVNFGILEIGIEYPPALLNRLMEQAGKSSVVQAQMASEETDILTGFRFGETDPESEMSLMDLFTFHPENLGDAVTVHWEDLDSLETDETKLTTQRLVRILREFSRKGKSETLKAMVEAGLPLLMDLIEIDEERIQDVISYAMDEEQMQEMYAARAAAMSASYSGNMSKFGYADAEDPSSITIYPTDFESKNEVIRILDAYNETMEKEGYEEKVISFTDYVGSLMDSVTTIIDVITYVLIAFVAVSLVVSSIMIGIITYISVLERRKEIGILRAMGASKRNITEVFNAETFIIGLLAGVFGILLTLLLQIPINHLIRSYSGQEGIRAFLPPGAGTILVILCIFLTFIGGFIPSRQAARQDPVAALRSE